MIERVLLKLKCLCALLILLGIASTTESPATIYRPSSLETFGSVVAPEKGLHRPKLRKGTEEAIDAKTPRVKDGRFLNIDGKPTSNPVYGHKRGHENWREIERAEAQWLSQGPSNDRMNNPELYQIEDRLKNADHSREIPR